MSKGNCVKNRRRMSFIMSTALVFSSFTGGMQAKADSIYETGTSAWMQQTIGNQGQMSEDTEWISQIKQAAVPAPEEETTYVEVFSEDGSMRHELADSNVFYDVNDLEYLKDHPEQSVSQIADTYNFEYRDLVNNGDDGENYCILIMGDGYTASEQNKFISVATDIANYFMTRSPFNESNIRNKINIRAVCTISNHSGVQEAQDGANNPYDTFFKSTFWNNTIERLVCIHDQARADAIIDQYMPDCKCPIVVCNTTKYGGSGGGICTISANEKAPDIAFHEFGHTGAGLADEYWEGTYDSWNRFEGPNRTLESDPSKCKWADLIGNNGIGLYAFEEAGVYDCFRPHQYCEMRYLEQEFCEVCKRHIRSVINDVVNSSVPKNAVINTAAELQDYCNRVSGGAATTGKTVTLNADINLSGSNNISMMKDFNGTFDGNGHKITGINMSSSDGTYGFIGTLGTRGEVKNLHLENAYIQGAGFYVGGIAGNVKGKITGCSVSGNVRGENGVGGIAGHTESGAIIQDNYNTATIYASNQVAGGIVGWAGGGTVVNNFNYGDITGGSSWANGIMGWQDSTTYSNNYNLSGKGGNSYGTAKSASEFSNGTVLNLLNSFSNVWKQGSSYPVHSYTSQNVGGSTAIDAFSLIEAESRSSASGTVIDNNSSRSGGKNIGGVSNNTSITFDAVDFSEAASSISMCYSTPSGCGGYTDVYVDDGFVGRVTMDVNGSSWSDYSTAAYRLESNIPAGTHKVKLQFVTSGSSYYVCNLDYFNFIRANGDTTTKPGYTMAGADWTNVGVWGCYFGNWAGTAQGAYKLSGNSFSLYYIEANPGATWLSQASYLADATPGHTYRVDVSVTLDKEASIGIKEDLSNVADNPVYTNIAAGQTVTLTGTYTVAADQNQIKVMFELGNVTKGTTLTFNSVTITDVTPKSLANGIEMNGYQVNAKTEGMRVVYTVDSTFNGKDVTESGMIYGLAGYVNDSDMVAGSNNSFVRKYASTNTGKFSSVLSETDYGTTYAMTMRFAQKNALEYNATFKVRAYARLSDGSYIYTNVYSYRIYDIADSLYRNRSMPNATYHNYLYTDILTVVNSGYGWVNY